MIKHEALPYSDKRMILERIQKGEEVNLIPPILKGVPTLPLSQAGKLRLLAYPIEGVTECVERTIRARSLSPIPLLFKNLGIWCKHHNVSPDVKWSHQLVEAYKIDPGASSEEIKRSAPNRITIAGIHCTILSEEDANARRAEFITNPGVIAGIDKFAALFGYEYAKLYFQRVLENLKYLADE